MVDQIDPRIVAGNGGQANMLGQFNELAHASVAMQQNRLLSQEANSRQRMGELAQQHTDAQGNFNSTEYVKHILSDPQTAPFAPQVANQFAERGLIDANTLAKNIENWKQQADIISSTAYSTAQGIPSDSQPADTKSFIGKVADLSSVRHPDGSVAFPVEKLTGYLTSAMQGVRTNADLKQHVLQMAQFSLRNREMLENIGTQQGLGPNGEPKLYFYNRAAQGQGAGGNAQAAGAYMAGAGGVGPGGNGSPVGAAGGGGAAGGAAEGPIGGAANATGAPPTASPPGAPAPAPGGPNTPSSSITLGPSAPRQAQLEYMGKTYWPQLQEAGEQSQSMLNFLGEARSLLRDYTPGRGAELRTELARLLEAGGADPNGPVVRAVANGDVSNAQAFQKLTVAMATQWMRQANEGNAAVRSSTEWLKFQNAFPGLENDPKAIQKMYNYMRFLADMTQQKQKSYQNFERAPGYDIAQFPSKWNEFANTQLGKFLSSPLGK